MAARLQMHHQVETNEHVVLHDDAVVAHGAAVSGCLSCATLLPKSAGQSTLPGLTQGPQAQDAAFCRSSQHEVDNLEACLGDLSTTAASDHGGGRAGARSRNRLRRLHRPPSRELRGAGGGTRTPTGIAALRIFLPATAFTALVSRHGTGRRVCGLDYPFTMLRTKDNPPEVRCCPSSLYTFPSRRPGRGRLSGLGSGLPGTKVSPSLGSSAPGVSPGALKLHPKSVASTAFATPA